MEFVFSTVLTREARLHAYGALGAAAGGVSRWLAAHPAYMRGVNRGSAGLFVASGAAVLLLDRRQ